MRLIGSWMLFTTLLRNTIHSLSVLSTAIFMLCHLRYYNAFHLVFEQCWFERATSCANVWVCEVECVGLNRAGVHPVCPELAWLSTLLCSLKLKIGLGLQALSPSAQLTAGAQHWTTLDSQHNSTLSTRCALSPDIKISDLTWTPSALIITSFDKGADPSASLFRTLNTCKNHCKKEHFWLDFAVNYALLHPSSKGWMVIENRLNNMRSE